MPSASSPTASLIAATWPAMVWAGSGLEIVKVRDAEAPRPVELDGDLGEQDERARLVGIEALEVDTDGGVGVRGDGAAFAVDRAGGQALGKLDDQHATQHPAQRLAPPVVRHDVELVAFRRAHDLAAVEIARQADVLQRARSWDRPGRSGPGASPPCNRQDPAKSTPRREAAGQGPRSGDGRASSRSLLAGVGAALDQGLGMARQAGRSARGSSAPRR